MKNDTWRPVSYFSKKLTPREQNYSTTERELYAIVLAIEHFRQFLYGIEFDVITDHQPLKYMFTVENPANRLARWLDRLKNYNFNIEYRKGNTNGNADALSRMVSEDVTVEERERDEPISVNAIVLTSDKINSDQLEDEDIKWIYDLKKKAQNEKVDQIVVTDFANRERRSLYAQWERLKLSGNNIYREYTEEESD